MAIYSVIHPTSITLEWTAIPPEHLNGILAGYVATTVPSDGSEAPQEIILEPNLVTFEIMGVRPNTRYNVTIAAFTAVGRGPISSTHVTLLPRGM